MRLVVISDTHNSHRKGLLQTQLIHLAKSHNRDELGNLVLIHCGDFTNTGTFDEIQDFCEWMQWLAGYDYKLIIPGNHEYLLTSTKANKRELQEIAMDMLSPRESKEKGLMKYLDDESIEIEGFTIYGCGMMKSKAASKAGENPYEHIPPCDILVTHYPPHQ
jgi:predicted phosphodiesterase